MKKILFLLQKPSLPLKIKLLCFAIAGVIGFYALCIEPFLLRITTWPVHTEKWPHEKPLRITIITDIHMKWPSMTPAHLDSIVDKANNLDPDIVVLLGDYVATHPFGLDIPPEKGVIPLTRLQSKCGVFAVGGNHDFHPPSRWPDVLRATDIKYLENEAQKINCNGQEFWIGGLAELWWQNADIQKTLENVPKDKPVIMLMHNPDSFIDIPNHVTLSLAGHTHAGQIRFPFIGAVESVIPSKYGKRFVYGHIQENGKNLIVSSGIGMTGIPLRLMTPPEIALITLQKE